MQSFTALFSVMMLQYLICLSEPDYAQRAVPHSLSFPAQHSADAGLLMISGQQQHEAAGMPWPWSLVRYHIESCRCRFQVKT